MGFSLFTDFITPKEYKVPKAVTVDPTQNQLDTVSGNKATFAAAKDLATQYNDFMASEVSKRLKESFPQFEGLQTSGAQVIADRLAGRLSTSDAAASQRRSAASALGSGRSVLATTLRDLGISQENAKSAGLAELPGFTSTVLGAKKAPMFDFGFAFLTPEKRWQQTYTNKTNEWNVENLRNQMKAQPEPWMKALAGFGDSLLTAAGSYLTMGTGNFDSPSATRAKAGGGAGFTTDNWAQNNRMMQESGQWSPGSGPGQNSGYWNMFE